MVLNVQETLLFFKILVSLSVLWNHFSIQPLCCSSVTTICHLSLSRKNGALPDQRLPKLLLKIPHHRVPQCLMLNLRIHSRVSIRQFWLSQCGTANYRQTLIDLQIAEKLQAANTYDMTEYANVLVLSHEVTLMRLCGYLLQFCLWLHTFVVVGRWQDPAHSQCLAWAPTPASCYNTTNSTQDKTGFIQWKMDPWYRSLQSRFR